MEDENGKSKEIMENDPSKIFAKPFKEISIYTIKEKLSKNELTIEDILSNNECINDLRSNPNSRYKIMLDVKNIKKLINFCLDSSTNNKGISYETLRYPYYSCEILCSSCILHFSKSIKSIKEANNKEKNENMEGKNINIYSDEPTTTDDYFNKDEEKQETGNDYDYGDYFFGDKCSNYIDNHKAIETEVQKSTMENVSKTQFNEEEIKIIEEILNSIFHFLDNENRIEDTYIGYFQKIVNYLLINEPATTYNYLKLDEYKVIQKFYIHIYNASIENIFENILNYIIDQENKEDNSDKDKPIFNKIMIDLLNKISKMIDNQYNNNDDNINKYYDDKNCIEFICELIINTLINNSKKHLAELVFSDNQEFLTKIKEIVKNSVELESEDELKIKGIINHKKTLIINLLEIVRQINLVIINSKDFNSNSNYKDDINFFKDTYKNLKTFENQYFCKVEVKIDIFKIFVEKREIYLYFIKNLYGLVGKDIKNTYKNYKNQEKKIISLLLLYEWKYIIGSLKLFIFQLYSIENIILPEDQKDFYDEDLFNLSLELYFNFPKNNIYQNIFIDLIKIINFEKTPNYLINHFIKKQIKFIIDINNIINYIENKNKIIEEKNNKNSQKNNHKYIEDINNKNIDDKINKDKILLLGPNIQILLIFYTSQNPALLKFYLHNDNNLEQKFKEEFFFSIKPRFERKFKENYEFTEEEIFMNDSIDTFDGNDLDNVSKIKFESLKTDIVNFFNKLNMNYNNLLNKMSEKQKESEQNQMPQNQNAGTVIKIYYNEVNAIVEKEEPNPEGGLKKEFEIPEDHD